LKKQTVREKESRIVKKELESLNLTMQEKEAYDRAKKFASKERYPDVIPILKGLLEKYPDSVVLRHFLAFAYWELEDLQPAAAEFSRVVQLDPLLQGASLGLFNCLWDQDKLEEAFDEMNRFQKLTNFQCEDYKEIMEEIKAKNKQEES
jgi:predicted Zn-dependent protease